jgi:Protein of unknown function (DUF3800)
VTPAELRLWAASSIGRLALSLFPAAPHGRASVILTAHYDESGTHAGAPLTVLAGFVGSSDEWVGFEREWRKVLKKHKITHIRAKHLWHHQKQHRGWTEAQEFELINDCLYVFQEFKQIFASKTILREEDYKLFYVSDGPARKERLDSRYALCFRAFMHFLPHLHHSRFAHGAINFVLEAGHRNAGDAVRVFNELKSDRNFIGRDAIGMISFGAKRDSPALQAADMLAYWVYGAHCESAEAGIKDEHIASGLESDLVDSGLTIINHKITPDDLKNMRMNFLRKRKRKVLQNIELDLGVTSRGVDDPAVLKTAWRPRYGW